MRADAEKREYEPTPPLAPYRRCPPVLVEAGLLMAASTTKAGRDLGVEKVERKDQVQT